MYESTSPTPPLAVFTGGPSADYIPGSTGTASTIESSSSGLSVGAKAGVGVGVVVGALVLAALLWFAYAMGKRRSRAAPSNPPEYNSAINGEGKQSKVTLYSVDSSIPIGKPSATDEAYGIGKSCASDARV